MRKNESILINCTNSATNSGIHAEKTRIEAEKSHGIGRLPNDLLRICTHWILPYMGSGVCLPPIITDVSDNKD